MCLCLETVTVRYMYVAHVAPPRLHPLPAASLHYSEESLVTCCQCIPQGTSSGGRGCPFTDSTPCPQDGTTSLLAHPCPCLCELWVLLRACLDQLASSTPSKVGATWTLLKWDNFGTLLEWVNFAMKVLSPSTSPSGCSSHTLWGSSCHRQSPSMAQKVWVWVCVCGGGGGGGLGGGGVG